MESMLPQDIRNVQNDFNKRSIRILIAGRILLIATLFYTAWWLYHLSIDELYLYLLFNITMVVIHCVVIISSIMTIASSIAIIRKEKRGLSILVKSFLVDLIFLALIISLIGIPGDLKVSFVLYLYFATKISVLIYLWRNKQELL